MALLKIINNNYHEDSVHFNLVRYALYPKITNQYGYTTTSDVPANYYGCYNLFLGDFRTLPDNVSSQMNSALSYFNKDYGQFLRHFILSFDSMDTESQITPEKAFQIASVICTGFFHDYQVFFSIHENTPSHLHIHFIINSVNLLSGLKLPDKRETHQTLASFIRKNTVLSSCKVIYE